MHTIVYNLLLIGPADVLKLFKYNLREVSQQWISEAGCTTCVTQHI